ncbi:MAG TPA: hypothetical protein VLT33_26975 [Labilithrix sp.]|nr:hypothetical protein [Labilithrix sp.]
MAAVLALASFVAAALGSNACSDPSPGGAVEFPLPDDPLSPSHPYPASRQIGPAGLRLPAGVLEADLPAGGDGDLARGLMGQLREQLAELDGSGVTAVIHAPFEGELDPTTLAGEVDVVGSDGTRAPIAVEVVGRALEIRPARPWDAAATYVVVVRHARDTHGEPCRPSAGVRTLLAEDRADAFEQERTIVRAALVRAAIGASDVCLAFSFHVEDVMSRARGLRDRVTALAQRTPPSYAIGEVKAAHDVKGLTGSTHVDRVVYGTYVSPVFRDAGGRVVDARVDGREEPPVDHLRFALSLPLNAKPPYRVVMGLHGLGGDIDGTLPLYAEYLGEAGFAYITIDGVAHGSRATPGQSAYASIFDIDDPRRTRDILRQTLADLYQLRLLVSGGLSIDGKGDTLQRSGIGWSGGSYGGIFGTMLAATDPGIEAAHVEACGAPWRDVVLKGNVGLGFVQFLFAARAGMGPDNDAFAPTLSRYLDFSQWIVDSADASALAEYVTRRTIDGGPRPRLLMQYWVGETLMPNAASELLVRALDIPVTTASTDPSGTRGAWPIDVAKWGAPGGLEGHGAFWKIPAARRQATDFLASHGTAMRAPEEER